MEYFAELWARTYTWDWAVAAGLIAIVLSFLVRGIRSALLVAVLAVAIETLLPLGLEAAASGLPADPLGVALAAFQNLTPDVTALRYLIYALALFILGHAWRDMTRPYRTAHD
jgi:hypothetical protein